ncbi:MULTISPECIES: peptidylprolyl isomerase [Geobacillus]|uniref:Foldase protein PrsA n=3 Tax=Geobacillus thermoleovorans group TaxID=1505648 RepID=PRSA_GEOKA|nr:MULTISPECIES: peptidylprolyl isomerase [Geobacillus]Q5L289.1 RecName: Full=Foldase protein PrsA; Flags: Precursor [Geobacillus kaustophilus HTA426]AWO73773.1 foldase [Geobacillus thermoleovorans]MBW7642327.1 foldase [Geobacillus thermoleovorans]MED4973333.1 peptidylprolyl isomerase [Geobacillus thermoleovorans]ODA17739.1 peptidylprolyl isomerase [Geobacillus thermoleovorans]QCK82011.1 foldase [Geobacillus kaustophilus NBRC 102445]
MKKWMMAAAVVSLMALSACSNDGSEAIVETKNGNITKDEFYNEMKERVGKSVLRDLIDEKVLSKKYKVTDEEIDREIERIKEAYGTQYDLAVQQNGEKVIREMVKLDLLRTKAAVEDIKVTEKELKEYYDNYKPKIRASHILVKDEKTAKEVKAKLDKGEDFSKLAKEYSQDPGSASNGGDLGWFGPGKMVKEFEEAAYKLKVGEVSDPVKTDYGYHIIKVTDKEKKKSFNEMKDEIAFEVKRNKLDPATMQSKVDKLVKDAGVEIKDKDLQDVIEQQGKQ